MINNNTGVTSPITVILPVYNGGKYLELSVQSVLSQDLKNFEFLILDDCSTDMSGNYLESLSDERVIVYKNDTNKGLFYNLNFLINNCDSPLIKLWAQDDIMYPDCLSAFVNFHQEHPQIGFSYSSRDIIDEHGIVQENNVDDKTPSVISTALHTRIAYYTGSIAGNIANVCISRKAMEAVGLFKEDMKISADFDMWVRLAKNHDVGFINQKLIQLRDHSGQLSRNEKYYLNHVREDLEVYHYLNGYATPSLKKEGQLIMRKHKLVFYYTLMLKAILKGRFTNAYSFYKQLASYDSFFLLSVQFLKSKIIKPVKPDFSL